MCAGTAPLGRPGDWIGFTETENHRATRGHLVFKRAGDYHDPDVHDDIDDDDDGGGISNLCAIVTKRWGGRGGEGVERMADEIMFLTVTRMSFLSHFNYQLSQGCLFIPF